MGWTKVKRTFADGLVAGISIQKDSDIQIINDLIESCEVGVKYCPACKALTSAIEAILGETDQ